MGQKSGFCAQAGRKKLQGSGGKTRKESMGKQLRASMGFWIILVYAAALGVHLGWQTFSGATEKRELRGFYLQHALRVSKPLLREGRARELSNYLREAVEMGMIDSYELELLGKPLEKGGQQVDTRPVLAEPVSEVDGWVWGKFETADASLRLGSGVGWRARLALAVKSESARLPFDALFLSLSIFLSVFFQGRMRHHARRTATTVVRESRRAKVLRSERAPPVQEATGFEGVCGRAVLLLSGELAFEKLESFFADCAALVARYGGRVSALQGNELLFTFSEGDPRHQARLALALLRDLDAHAASLQLAFASALSIGRVEAAAILPGSPSFFGAPVDETAALVRQQLVQKKPGRSLSPAMQKLCGERSGLGIDKALSDCKQGHSEELAYHRSDASIEAVLRALSSGEWEREAYVRTMNELRQVQCRRCGPALVEAFRALLAVELQGKDSYRLSGALALAPHLLSRALVDKDMEKMFLEAVKVKDRRVRANAVELFTRFFPEREVPELRPLIRDEDNRVSANALIKAACERFDEKVIARLEERVKGGSVAHVASALHAMGEIAAYYRRTDPLFLGTKIAFLRLFDGVPTFAQHPNPMIRRQALLAAKKLGSPPLNELLQHLFEVTSDPELLSLFASIYGWKSGQRRPAA